MTNQLQKNIRLWSHSLQAGGVVFAGCLSISLPAANIAVVSISADASAAAIGSNEASRADKEWATLISSNAISSYRESLLKFGSQTRPEFLASWNQRRAKFRELGLAFYHEFPEDPRRWAWLLETMERPPMYFLDSADGVREWSMDALERAHFDLKAKEAWRTEFLTELKPAFMTSPQLTIEQRNDLLFWELYWDLNDYYWEAKRSGKLELNQIEARILEFAGEPGSAKKSPSLGPILLVQTFIEQHSKLWRMGDVEWRALAAMLKTSRNSELRLYGESLGKAAEDSEESPEMKTRIPAALEALWGITRWGTRAENYAKYPEGTEEFYKSWSYDRALFCNLGLKFFDDFPHDSQRLGWLQAVVNMPPYFWRDADQGAKAYADKTYYLAEIDQAAKTNWTKRYTSELRPAYFAQRDTTDRMRMDLDYWWLFWELADATLTAKRERLHGQTPNLDETVNKILNFAASYQSGGDYAVRLIQNFIYSYADTWQFDYVKEQQFLDAMRASPSTVLRVFAEKTIADRNGALELKFTAFDGREIDLKNFKGKVVAIDFWATWCAPCVQAIPDLNALYAKYHGQGFEIIGVAADRSGLGFEDSEMKFRAFLKRHDMQWPQWYNYAEVTDYLKQQNIDTLGQILLVDPQGRVVYHEVGGSPIRDLEPLIREHLGLPPLLSAPEPISSK